MKKIILLTLISVLFLNRCAQNVGVKIDPEYKPEVRVVSSQDYPELTAVNVIQKIYINGKEYDIKRKEGREIARLPRKFLKNWQEYPVEAGLNDYWNFEYDNQQEVLEAVPKIYTVPITLLRQNPKQVTKNRPFVREDLNQIALYYKSDSLTQKRYIPKHGRPDMIQLKIPSFPKVKMDDYKISIDLPGYEKYEEKIINIQDKTVKLKLKKSMLRFKFVNLENSVYEPGFIYLQNQYDKLEKYSSRELKQGISIYNAEFPVQLFSQKKSVSLFDKSGNAIDTLTIAKPGFYDFLFKENMREFPAVFYDLSQGKTTPGQFEKWINQKKAEADGVFLYVTNGYEKIYNSNPDNIISVTNKIYRLTPRTSNVLESIQEFTQRFKGFANNANLNDEEVYGAKLSPRYYLFLSDENVERLAFAVNKLTAKIAELNIPKDKVIIYINASKTGSSIIKQLKTKNFNIQTI